MFHTYNSYRDRAENSVQQLIKCKRITKSQALALTEHQIEALKKECILKAVVAGTLDIKSVVEVHSRLVHKPNVENYINRGLITLEQAVDLTEGQAKLLDSDRMRKLINGKHVTMGRVLRLSQNVLDYINQATMGQVLRFSPNVLNYINRGLITLEQAVDLTEGQAKLLDSDRVREFINGNRITMGRVLRLSPNVLNYLNQDLITLEQAVDLTEGQAKLLNSNRVRKLINGKHVTMGKVLGLSQNVLDYINHGLITLEQAVDLTEGQAKLLDSDRVRELINGKHVTMGKKLRLSQNVLDYINQVTMEQVLRFSPNVLNYINRGLITLEQAVGLTEGQAKLLDSYRVRELINGKYVTMGQVLSLSQNVLDYINRDLITLRQAVDLTEGQAKLLDSDRVRKLINGKHVTMGQVLSLSQNVLYYLNQGLITLKQVVNLETQSLDSRQVRQLISVKRISMDQALALNWWQINALENQGIFDKVNAGKLDIRLAHVPELQDRVDKNIITLEQAINVDKRRARNLDSKEVKRLIDDHRITMNQALKFLYWEEDTRVRKNKNYIDRDLITLETVLSLEKWQVEFLDSYRVRELINGNSITMGQVLSLSQNVLYYINRGLITLEQAVDLTEGQAKLLDSDRVRKLIHGKYVTMGQVLSLSQNVLDYINRNFITFERVLNLEAWQAEFLSSEQVRELIYGNFVTMNQVLALTSQQASALSSLDPWKNRNIFDYINRGLITLGRVVNLESWQAKFLNSWQARKLINGNRITMGQVLGLSQNVLDYINRGLITLEQAVDLTEGQAKLLDSDRVRELIDDKDVTMGQVLRLSQNVLDYINRDLITLERAVNLTVGQAKFLDSYYVRNRINDKRVTMGQVLRLSQNVLDYINRDFITLEQAVNLTERQAEFLNSDRVRDLINDNHVTIDQILGFTNPQLNTLIRAVNNRETRQRLGRGEITVQDILNQNILNFFRINHRQSTHTASVHKSISESALRLFERYGSELNEVGLDNIIENLSDYVQSLPDNSEKNQVAKRAIRRITAIDFTFTDPGSDISTRQILALIWIAINKISKQLVLFEKNAKQALVEGFYEIQREYNLADEDNVRLDIADTDNGGLDWPTCISGTFNKLVEKMNTILPEVEIIFINHESACIKIQSVVREKTLECLRSAKRDKPELFPQLLTRIQDEGVEVIWDEIQKQVKTRMYEEFGSLFPGGPDGEGFCGFIETGKDTDIEQLISDQFKKGEEDDTQVEETRMSFTP